MIRVLGLDVGTVRIGVALSDPLGMTAQPLEVIVRKKTDPARRIQELIAEYEIQKIVVGQPYTLSGEEGQAVAAVASFVDDLKQHVTIPIELWDERMSTAQAERMMISGGARRDKRKQSIDKIAASLILQSYLDAHVGSL
ncbi:MAG: Holliday junction resolvase RuvX [Myxococcota bacterium]